ncbi:hypothetical protein [Methylobacterium sp. R2-1]|uniref:hypothetical protein n=1 Tax=Methylobacterium sp. R2-1 TaxID=2587064 RepID=UPI00160B2FF1|nr:hypothetical protein [Methylobacterium sp. R2-1]
MPTPISRTLPRLETLTSHPVLYRKVAEVVAAGTAAETEAASFGYKPVRPVPGVACLIGSNGAPPSLCSLMWSA